MRSNGWDGRGKRCWRSPLLFSEITSNIRCGELSSRRLCCLCFTLNVWLWIQKENWSRNGLGNQMARAHRRWFWLLVDSPFTSHTFYFTLALSPPSHLLPLHPS